MEAYGTMFCGHARVHDPALEDACKLANEIAAEFSQNDNEHWYVCVCVCVYVYL